MQIGKYFEANTFFGMMLLVNWPKKMHAFYNYSVVFIIILDHENVVVGTTFISLSCILSEILKKLDFATMAVANLHIRNIYMPMVPNGVYHNH